MEDDEDLLAGIGYVGIADTEPEQSPPDKPRMIVERPPERGSFAGDDRRRRLAGSVCITEMRLR
jgi:hypothetical protein